MSSDQHHHHGLSSSRNIIDIDEEEDSSSFQVISSSIFDETSAGHPPYLHLTDISTDHENEGQEDVTVADDYSGLRSPTTTNCDDEEDEEDLLSIMENCMETSNLCLQYCREEQDKLKKSLNLIAAQPPPVPAAAAAYINDAGFLVGNADNINSTEPTEFEDTQGQEEEEGNKATTGQQFHPSSSFYLPSDASLIYARLEERLTSLFFSCWQPPPVSHQHHHLRSAVLLGFVVSFVLLTSYSVIQETLLTNKLETYANLTKTERLEKEKYRKETDIFRETLMHKSYEEARQSTDELKECQKINDILKSELANLKADLLRANLEAREAEIQSKRNLLNLNQFNEALKLKNKQLREETESARKIKNNLNFTVAAAVLFTIFSAVLFTLNKQQPLSTNNK